MFLSTVATTTTTTPLQVLASSGRFHACSSCEKTFTRVCFLPGSTSSFLQLTLPGTYANASGPACQISRPWDCILQPS
ncbi:hypothetical protein BJY01DRAFT_229995 [Aspergillus pseudoustus]|uniref:Secreted protein n=1 Tax=Aspergillus pseudoustus TaxID=1810923 RepID=A0ABR4IGI8_9EURO